MLAAVLHGQKDLRVEPRADRPLESGEVRVRTAFGGICGSDLHYFHRGAVGDFAVRQPMVLGHEISGTVVEAGPGVSGIEPGQKAALDPSRACRHCDFCREGRSNLCENMRFLGSASLFPHVDGGFSQHLILRADQVIPVPDATDLLKLSCAEPLSVALHAVSQAGSLFGKRVIVTGSGPIGLLTVAAIARAGAREIVATDVEDAPLAVARTMGATATVNVASAPQELDRYASSRGYFDVAVEASGTASALQSLFAIVRRGGRIVQLGMLPPGTAPVPVNRLQARELELVGAFRAADEFRAAVDCIVEGRIDVSPILSGTIALDDATSAFERAGNRKEVIKLHLAF